jgi:CDP-diacylglycerol--glycerol-3-phosphate 3-phosphatidyltransferase
MSLSADARRAAHGQDRESIEQEERSTHFQVAASRASLMLALGLLAALAASLALGALTPLAVAGPLGLAFLAWQLRSFGSTGSSAPNLVTALRVMLTALLALGLPGAPADPAWLQAGLIALVFGLDGVDGYLARTLRASSLQGARLDMEADGYLVLIVCSLHALAGLGAWVLIGCLLRYAYVIVIWLFDGRGQPPRLRFARYAFAVSLTSLTLALLTRGAAALALAALGTAILTWSFSRSLLWAFRG